MGEKKEGKENEKCSTMPDVLIKGYKILRTVSGVNTKKGCKYLTCNLQKPMGDTGLEPVTSCV